MAKKKEGKYQGVPASCPRCLLQVRRGFWYVKVGYGKITLGLLSFACIIRERDRDAQRNRIQIYQAQMS